MAIRMLLTEDSPTKVVLQTNPAYNQDRDKTYSSSLRSGLGCFGIFAILLVVILFYFFTRPLSSLPWYFWVFAASFFVALIVFISIEISFINFNRNFPRETTVIIDLDSQRATRMEKSRSGKIKQFELRLEQVTRVLVHGDDLGHRLELTLESNSSPPFEVNSDVFFDSTPIMELGKKLGDFIKKPVVFKITDAGKPVSEETIQP